MEREFDMHIVVTTGGCKFAAIRADMMVIPDTIPLRQVIKKFLYKLTLCIVAYIENEFQNPLNIKNLSMILGANLKTSQIDAEKSANDVIVRKTISNGSICNTKTKVKGVKINNATVVVINLSMRRADKLWCMGISLRLAKPISVISPNIAGTREAIEQVKKKYLRKRPREIGLNAFNRIHSLIALKIINRTPTAAITIIG